MRMKTMIGEGRLAVLSVLFIGLAATASGQSQLNQTLNGVTISGSPGPGCYSAFANQNFAYFRSFNLQAQGVTSDIRVTGITFAIRLASSFLGGSVPIHVHLFRDISPVPGVVPQSGLFGGGPPMSPNLVPLHSESFLIPTGVQAHRQVVLSPSCGVPFGLTGNDQLVVAIRVPGSLAFDSQHFEIGWNSDGETAPGFIEAPNCGVTSPITLTAYGWPGTHILLAVDYETSGGYVGTDEDLVLDADPGVGAFSSSCSERIDLNLGDIVTLRCASPSGTFVGLPLLGLGEVFSTGSPPVPAFPGIAVSGNSATTVIFEGGSVPGLSPLVLPVGPHYLSFIWPASPGASFLVQYIVQDGTASNGIFGSTHGVELY